MDAGTMGEGRAADGVERVGIVVPVPEPHLSRLGQLRSGLGDEFAMVPPHVTLVTGAPVSDWNAVVEHVASVAADLEPCRLRFDGSATFRPLTAVVYAAMDGPSARWAERAHRLLQAGPLATPPAYPFVPHVTLAHGLDDAVLDAVQQDQAGERWEFLADRIALFGDRSDNDWRLRATFPLGNA